MEEIHKLRAQINNIVQANFPGVDTGYVSNLGPPSALQVCFVELNCCFFLLRFFLQLKVIRQLLTAGFIDQVAVRKDRVIQTSTTGVQFATSKGVAYRALRVEEDVFIHPSSILASSSPPEYVIFHEIVRTSRVWLKGINLSFVLHLRCSHIFPPRSHSCQPGVVINSWKAITLYLFKTCENHGWDDGDTKVWARRMGTACC